MKNKYINVHFDIKEEFLEMAGALLCDYPFTGIIHGDNELIVSFNLENWNESVKKEIIIKLNNYIEHVKILQEEIIIDKNWNEEWSKSVPTVIVSPKICITPIARKNEVDHPIKILIQPKMAFGTGLHPTTRLVCRLLDETVKPGDNWIDAGTGTGVLSILAIMLGAEHVLAFDNDEWSVENAYENFKENKVQDKIQLHQADIEWIKLPESNGICANMFTNLIVPSLPKFYNSLKNGKGYLICSGILIEDTNLVKEAAKKEGFDLSDYCTEVHESGDEWVALLFKAGD